MPYICHRASPRDLYRLINLQQSICVINTTFTVFYAEFHVPTNKTIFLLQFCVLYISKKSWQIQYPISRS